MNRFTFIRRFALVLLLAVGIPALVWAAQTYQYTISRTTLNGAINASQTTLVLTSASASAGSSFGAPAAGQCLWVDNELMSIRSMSSTTATVTRALAGAAGHATAAVVYTGPCSAFKTSDPPFSANAVCADTPNPWINVSNGNIWICGVGGDNKWYGSNAQSFSYASVPNPIP